jgi:hypothetical protein
VDSWGPKDHRLLESCAYPNYAQVRENGRADEEMDDLLENWSRLEVRGDAGNGGNAAEKSQANTVTRDDA